MSEPGTLLRLWFPGDKLSLHEASVMPLQYTHIRMSDIMRHISHSTAVKSQLPLHDRYMYRTPTMSTFNEYNVHTNTHSGQTRTPSVCATVGGHNTQVC